MTPIARLGSRSIGLCVLALLMLTLGAGCGYSLRSPYNPAIHTVYVPIFRTVNSFRRDLNLRLTEEVIKQIELQSLYKVVGNPEEADYVLEGEIISDQKNAVIQNPNNLPRQIQNTLIVDVAFFPTNGDPDPKRSRERNRIAEAINSYSELGETTSAAYDKAIQSVARQIVGKMELPW